MKIEDIYDADKQIISFEIFPPKDNTKFKTEVLKDELTKLMKYKPDLISVTYGAGGSTSGNSLNLVRFIKNNFDISIMPHYTCVNATRESVLDYLKVLKNEKIENILALRGDLIEGIVCKDFCHANELVSFVKENSELSIAVAGYPEKHPESKNFDDDLNNLKNKLNAGSKVIFTQLFFDNNYFKRYYERVKDFAPDVIINPGILPLSSYNQITRMCDLCKTSIPKNLMENLEKFKDSSEDITKIGIEFAISQIKELKEFGIKNFHFYILNKSEPISTILSEIREM